MKIKKVLITSRKKLAGELSDSLVSILKKHNIEYAFEELSSDNKDGKYKEADIILSMGGDGTLLASVDKASIYDKPVMGINLGNLGFLSELEKDEMNGIEKLFNGEYYIDERMMIESRFESEGKTQIFHCLNDSIVSRGTFPRMIKSEIYVSGHLAEEYTSDGIIVATPTGSTAYSLSAGGPVISPELDIMTITPICPHSLNSRSLIVGGEKQIEIVINREYNSRFFVSNDGRENLPGVGKVTIKKSKYTAKLIRVSNENFYSILHKKLAERGGGF